jgi:hypothetical protein
MNGKEHSYKGPLLQPKVLEDDESEGKLKRVRSFAGNFLGSVEHDDLAFVNEKGRQITREDSLSSQSFEALVNAAAAEVSSASAENELSSKNTIVPMPKRRRVLRRNSILIPKSRNNDFSKTFLELSCEDEFHQSLPELFVPSTDEDNSSKGFHASWSGPDDTKCFLKLSSMSLDFESESPTESESTSANPYSVGDLTISTESNGDCFHDHFTSSRSTFTGDGCLDDSDGVMTDLMLSPDSSKPSVSSLDCLTRRFL